MSYIEMDEPLEKSDNEEKYKEIEEAIDALDSKRVILGNTVIDTALGSMKKQLEELLHAARESNNASEEERRLVAVMFADLSGYTSLSEERDPEFVRELLNNWFNSLEPIIGQHEGMVLKYIGDEIMAIFEASVVGENVSEKSVRASLEMMNELVLFNKKQKLSLGMHIGISTGWVIAGGIGSEEQQQFGVVGDCVDLAKQLVDFSNEGEILVEPDTYHQTANRFNYDPQKTSLKRGQSESVTVYRLVGMKKGD